MKINTFAEKDKDKDKDKTEKIHRRFIRYSSEIRQGFSEIRHGFSEIHQRRISRTNGATFISDIVFLILFVMKKYFSFELFLYYLVIGDL